MKRALAPLALVLTAGLPCAADAPKPAPMPAQIRVKVELAVAPAARLRTNLAALIASGKASITDYLTVMVLEGTTARIQYGEGQPNAFPLRAAFSPAYRDGKLTARLDLTPGSGAAPAQAFHRQVTVGADELVAARFVRTADGSAGHLVLIRFDRVPQHPLDGSPHRHLCGHAWAALRPRFNDSRGFATRPVWLSLG